MLSDDDNDDDDGDDDNDDDGNNDDNNIAFENSNSFKIHPIDFNRISNQNIIMFDLSKKNVCFLGGHANDQ